MLNDTAAPSPSLGLLIGYLAAFPFLLWSVFWAVSQLLARASGWSALAEHYRAADDARTLPDVENGSGRVGIVGYGGVLGIGTSARGLYLEVAFFPGHPALLIPWHDVDVRISKSRPLTPVLVTVRQGGITLALSRSSADAILRYAFAEVR